MIMEIWKDIPDYEGFYQVSDLGRVKSLKRSVERSNGRDLNLKEKILTQTFDKDGYAKIHLSKSGKAIRYGVHRVVLKSFIGEKIEFEVNHINGIKADNRLVNLEYCTSSENRIHAYRILKRKHARTGLFNGNSPNAKKVFCFNTQEYFDSVKEASNKYNLHATQISAVCKNRINHIKGFKFKYA